MKKLFVFCMNGIIHALNEDGRELFSSVLCGFTQESYDNQMKFIKEEFGKCKKDFSKEYEVTFIKSPEEKQNLKEAIRKKIVYEKETYRNNDWEYWERDLTKINTPLFDYYN